MSISVVIPVKTVSEANMRSHWAEKAGRAKRQRIETWATLRSALGMGRVVGSVTVKLTRIAPRQLDGDNLRGALKAVRDGCADWLGIDDRESDRLQWLYDQKPGLPKQYAVLVEIA